MLRICGAVPPLPSLFSWYGAELDIGTILRELYLKRLSVFRTVGPVGWLVNDELEGMWQEVFVS
jgi:hypothetical protein